jgi:hypothetical protein
MEFLDRKPAITGESPEGNSGSSCAYCVPGSFREKENLMPLPFGAVFLQRFRFVIEITFECDSSPGEPAPMPSSIGPILQ